jgi:hypothetical protein
MWLSMYTESGGYEDCYLVVDVDPNMAYMPAEEVRVMPSPTGDDYCPTYMGTSFKYSNPDFVETGYLEIDGITYFMNPWENIEPLLEEYYGEEDDWEEDDWEEDDWEEDPRDYELYLTEEGSDLS